MCNSVLIQQITVIYTVQMSFGHEHPNKGLPLPEGRRGGGGGMDMLGYLRPDNLVSLFTISCQGRREGWKHSLYKFSFS